MRLINVLDLGPKSKVIDVGCGDGEILLRVCERYACQGVGIDPEKSALSIARSEAFGRSLSKQVQFVETTAEEFDWGGHPDANCVICIGSVHAYDGFENTVVGLAKRVPVGGLIVVGDLYWKAKPNPQYRELIGDGYPGDEITFHYLSEIGPRHGLVNLYASSSTLDEWDDFEGGFSAEILHANLMETEGGSERISALGEALRWRAGYLRWGRTTMGFGVFVFMKPSEEDQRVVKQLLFGE